MVITSAGPCAEGNIIQLNVTDSEPVSCVCRAGHLAWTDGVCYLRFSPGPCGPGGVRDRRERGREREISFIFFCSLSRRKKHLVSNLQSTISPIRLIIFGSTSEAKQTNKTKQNRGRQESNYFSTPNFFSNVKYYLVGRNVKDKKIFL